MIPRFQLYRDKAGEWRWRFMSGNGRIIADSAEGYKRKDACWRAIWKCKALMPVGQIQEVTGQEWHGPRPK